MIRIFLKDAGIDFQDNRYPYDGTWPAAKVGLQEKGISRTGKVPVLEYDGALLTQVSHIYIFNDLKCLNNLFPSILQSCASLLGN
jgi:hypothetical protein